MGRDNPVAFGIALVVLFFGALLLFRPPKKVAPRQSITRAELLELMRQRAREAVESAAADFGLALDFTPESVEKVEEILGHIHRSHLATIFNNDELTNESLRWGAYVGEVIKKVRPSEWAQDSAVGGPFSLPIVYAEEEGSESFPVGWCRKRIANGPEDNVWHKFVTLVLDRGKPQPEESEVAES